MKNSTIMIPVAAFNVGLAYEDILIYYGQDFAAPPAVAIASAVIVTGLIYWTLHLIDRFSGAK